MIRPEEQSDSELLRAMSAGDDAAFRVIYRRCHGPVYRFALHMTGNASIAEDVTQETFVTLIEDASRFDPVRGTLGAFLFGVGRNLLMRRIDRERNFVPFPEHGSPTNGAGSSRNGSVHRQHGELAARLVSMPVDLERDETIGYVRDAVLSLPENYREVVVLCDLQELSYGEAAGVLECAVGTVRSRLHRARALLTEKLREFHNPKQKSVAGEAAKS